MLESRPTAGGVAAESRSTKFVAWAVAVLILVTGCWIVWSATRLMSADMTSGAARKRVERWIQSNEAIQLAQWVDTRESLIKAVRIAPDNADLHIDLANLYVALGARRWDDEPGRKDDFTQAIEQLQRALELRPTDGMSWARLAMSYYAVGEIGPPLFEAWDRALQLAPVDPPVHQVLLETVMAIWPQATPEMQAWVQHFYMAAPEPTRKIIQRMGEVHGLEFELPEEAASAPQEGEAPPPEAAAAASKPTVLNSERSIR